jgi:hypothetical protein
MDQTAVEWFVEEMFNQGYLNDKPLTVNNIEYFVNQAKEMEKEQIKEAYLSGADHVMDVKYNPSSFFDDEQYYTETFKSE